MLCEGKLTQEECLKVLTVMKSNKSPSTDDLAVKFYKHSWKEISELLINSLNAGLSSQRETEKQIYGN